MAGAISPQLCGGDPLRILTSGPHFIPPVQLEMRHLLTDGGDLFSRYTLVR